MDNLEGFPERTCPLTSYRRWILFPSIFCKHYAPASCEGTARAGSWGEVGRRGDPSTGTAHTGEPPSHGVWAWQAEPGAGDRVCGQSQARWSDEAPSRNSKAQGWRLQHGSKVQPEDRAKDRTGYKLQRMYEESFQETSYLQPESVQEPEAGCRQVHPQQSSGKEQRARPELQGVLGQRQRGCVEVSPRLVCAVKGWWCPQGPETSRSLVGQMKVCLLCMLSSLTSTGTYNRYL